MLFAVICQDKAGAEDVRKANRDAHVAYLKESPVVFAGPFITDDGSVMTGSLIVLEFDNRSDAEAWAAADPYAKADLFASVEIRAWKKVLG
ncbi:MAG: YciI family protein [Neomegalonema sp.]|nr:YciI family protein [Neomegalonema sp.]